MIEPPQRIGGSGPQVPTWSVWDTEQAVPDSADVPRIRIRIRLGQLAQVEDHALALRDEVKVPGEGVRKPRQSKWIKVDFAVWDQSSFDPSHLQGVGYIAQFLSVRS